MSIGMKVQVVVKECILPARRRIKEQGNSMLRSRQDWWALLIVKWKERR